jgi:Fe2+ transport system protein FeoA
VNSREKRFAARRPESTLTETLSIPLNKAAPGQWVEFIRTEGGSMLSLRLATLGLLPHARFRIEQGGRSGPMLIAIRGVRLILGHGMASQIEVRPVNDTPG